MKALNKIIQILYLYIFSVLKSEQIATSSEERDNNSKENEALKSQLRKQDEEMQKKDHVIRESGIKAAESEEKIQMLESDVASKTLTFQSNAR